MEPMDESLLDLENLDVSVLDKDLKTEEINCFVENLTTKLGVLEERLQKFDQCYSLNTLNESAVEKKHQRELAGARRMQRLMCKFTAILSQLTQLPDSEPFREPVDVKGLGLGDYYEIIKEPMDLGTIKNKMKAVDATGYVNVREIYADVRLVFDNALKYYDERCAIHDMSKVMLSKFEEKWQKLLPEVIEEEERRADEENQAQLDLQLAQDVAQAKAALEINNTIHDANTSLGCQIHDVNAYMGKLREKVIQKCSKFSSLEKVELWKAISSLSPQNAREVVKIVANDNPGLQATDGRFVLDLNAQSESTLWKLKFFVKDVVTARSHTPSTEGSSNNINTTTNAIEEAIPDKRTRAMYKALTETAKRIRKNSK